MARKSKIVRTVYLSETMDRIITERKTLEERTMSAQIEHMLKKCLDFEEKENLRTIQLAEKQP